MLALVSYELSYRVCTREMFGRALALPRGAPVAHIRVTGARSSRAVAAAAAASADAPSLPYRIGHGWDLHRCYFERDC